MKSSKRYTTVAMIPVIAFLVFALMGCPSNQVQQANTNVTTKSVSTIPYEKVLSVTAACQVDAEDPYSGDWRRDKSYVRIKVKDAKGDEHAIRIPAVIESPKYTMKHYNKFKDMADRMKKDAMVRIHSAPSDGPSALEPGMVPQTNGKVWLNSMDETNDIVVPVTRISIIKTREIK